MMNQMSMRNLKKKTKVLTVAAVIGVSLFTNFMLTSEYSFFSKRKNIGVGKFLVGKEDRNRKAEKLYEEKTGQKKKLYAILLWDSCSEDGDIVRCVVNGVDYGKIPLLKAKVPLYVELKSGENIVQIIGEHDGVGGITLGLASSKSAAYTRVLQPGEVENFVIVNSDEI